MGIKFYKTEATRCPKGILRFDSDEKEACVSDLVFLSRPIIMRLIPPPSSGLLHLLKSS
jgi:hypothetical protein